MIRQFKDQDTEAVIALWRAASDLAHPFLSKDFQNRAESLTRDVYLKMAETWVYERDSQIVGFIGLLEAEPMWHIGGLFVRPDCHGQGFGRALVDHATALKGPLSVDVFVENTIGRAFYKAYGFVGDEQLVDLHSGFPLLKLTYEQG